MDARTQLEAERERLEAALLAIEQEWQRLMPEDEEVLGPGLTRGLDPDRALQIGSLLSSLGLVNAELTSIRHRDENGLKP